MRLQHHRRIMSPFRRQEDGLKSSLIGNGDADAMSIPLEIGRKFGTIGREMGLIDEELPSEAVQMRRKKLRVFQAAENQWYSLS